MKEREALVNMIMADFSESLDAMNDGDFRRMGDADARVSKNLAELKKIDESAYDELSAELGVEVD